MGFVIGNRETDEATAEVQKKPTICMSIVNNIKATDNAIFSGRNEAPKHDCGSNT